MSDTSGDTLTKYTDPTMREFMNEAGGGYYNYGKLAPDTDTTKMTSLREANESMVEYIISELGITTESRVLDLACGQGMYLVQIAARTGCSFVGTDKFEVELEQARRNANEFGVNTQGKFLESSWEEMSEEVKGEKFTHILSMGALHYGHPIIDEILNDIAGCCDLHTKVFLWDIDRCTAWEDCSDPNIHLQMSHAMLSRYEMISHIEESALELTKYEDWTPFIIPGYEFLCRMCEIKDPEMKILTYPKMKKAFIEGKLSNGIYYLRLKRLN